MKTQIRRGVFETNSSSTHSIQVVKGDLAAAYQKAVEMLTKSYYEKVDEDLMYDAHDYIDEYRGKQTFFLNGINFESGDENRNVYSICYSWFSKIQYLAMLAKSNEASTKEQADWWKEEHERFPYDKYQRWEDREHDPAFQQFKLKFVEFENTQFAKTFADFVLKYIQEHYPELGVEQVEYDLRFDIYQEGNLDFTEYDYLHPDEFCKKAEQYLKDGNTIIDTDEAYNPYDKPTINIY